MRSALVGLIAVVLLLLASPCQAQNSPPIADAGPDQELRTGEITMLEGSATDPDGNDILDWLWTIESSPPGSDPYLEDPTNPGSFFAGDLLGAYLLSLIAFDGIAWSDPDTTTMQVIEILSPVAIADASPTAGEVPLTVQFDGSQSYDPQGGTLSHEWNLGDRSDLVFEESPVHTYTEDGRFVAVLRVFDELGQSDVDTIEIIVFSGPPRLPDGEGGSEPLRVTKLDPDGSQLEVTWDGTCSTTATNILYGPLEAVASYSLSGSECLVTTPHFWDLVPAGGLWFLVVSDDGAGMEGSWGLNSYDLERNGPVASSECGNTTKWTHYYAVCP